MTARGHSPRLRALAALLAALVLLPAAGCRKEEGAKPAGEASPAAAAGTPRRGGTVVLGFTAEPGGVNELTIPASQMISEVIFRVFLHLVEEQPDFEKHPATFKPQLARSWEWSPDHKVLTFHLRDDAVWSDGVPVTAEDVRWTWQAQTDKDVVWDKADSKSRITDVEVVDPHTVRFHFARVYAKQLLDANEGMILPKHAWEKLPFSQWRQSGDWFKQHLVTDGPFTIASWEPGQQLVLQRNDRYFEKGLPRLDRAVIRFVPDPATGFTQLLNGEVDFVPQVTPKDVPRVEARPDLALIAYWFNLYVALGWNNDNPLFRAPEVRRALTLGIDRQTIVDTVLGRYGRIADSPVIQSVWAHDDTLKPWPYDREEAKRILAAKGWRDTDGDGVLDKGGRPFAFELITNTGNSLRGDAMVMIQSQLKQIGVRATPRLVEFNTLADASQSGKFEAMILGFTMDTSLDLTTAFHSRSIAQGSNYMRYRNAEVDRLIDLAAAQPSVEAERPYLDQIQQILHREQPLTFLWESQRLTAINRRVKGAKPTMLQSLFNLQEWWVEPKR